MMCQISAASLSSLQVWPRNLVKEEEECFLCYFIPPKVLHCKAKRDMGMHKSFQGGDAALLQLWLHVWCSHTSEPFTWALLEPEHICELPQARENEQKTAVNWGSGRAEAHRAQLKQKSKLVPCGHKLWACRVAWGSVGWSSAPLVAGQLLHMHSLYPWGLAWSANRPWQLWWWAGRTLQICTNGASPPAPRCAVQGIMDKGFCSCFRKTAMF